MTLNFSPPTPDQIRQLRGGPAVLRNIGGKDSGGVASDPDGTISIFEALDKQLGLKLKSRKVMGTVLVVDHVNEMPTAN